MVQWVGVCLTIIGMVYNGYQQYRQTVVVQPQLTIQQPAVQSQQPIRYYQAAFDPNTGKIYFLNPDGQWYEQIPQIRTNQTQPSPGVGVGQGSQPASLGQRDARLASETATNPWVR